MPEITNEEKKPVKKTTKKTDSKVSTTKKTTTKKPATAAKAATKKVNTTTKTTEKKATAKKRTSIAQKAEPTKTVAKTTTKKAQAKKTASKVSEKKKTTVAKKTTTKKESVAKKAVKEAKEKAVKDTLKKEIDKAEIKKVEPKVEVKAENKSKVKKQETVIQKIKNFIAKIIAMQEEARKESENKKALQESLKEDIEETQEEEPKTKYMLEYYDLPYRYNETVVKILAQTPKRLFVYWDISDYDRNRYKEAFGERFFEDTYPVLLVHNEEKNYTFEVPINDFANSWYLDINDPKSKYVIQLGRKFKAKPEFVNIAITFDGTTIELQNDYVPITTSNVLEVPNDHILFEKVGTRALYRNVKTNEESYIDIANADFMKKMGNIYSIYDLYKEIYKNELGDGSLTDLLNPSSMSSSGTNSSMFR